MTLKIQQLVIKKAKRNLLTIDNLFLKTTGMIALIGPNGSGKSTLLKTIAGLMPSHSGEIIFNGKNILPLSARQKSQFISYIPQQFQPCWNQTTKELLDIALTKIQSPLDEQEYAIKQFELTPILHRHWQHLSGGEQARVLLAMSLIGKPKLVLADEPGAALDIKHHLHMLEILKIISQDSLVIVCLHDLNLSFHYFDHVIFLREGELYYAGETENLINSQLIDKGFGVSFLKIKTEIGWCLQASSY